MILFDSIESFSPKASVAFSTVPRTPAFREDDEITPVPLTKNLSYMPWGADNMLPYNIMDIFEADETMSTCSVFNAEICYGAGLEYDTVLCSASVANAVREFTENNDMQSYWFGISQDIKMFGFAVSVIILNTERTRILSVSRREACYCRFSTADATGHIPYVIYANWRNTSSPESYEKITLLDRNAPLLHLRSLLAKRNAPCKFAVVSRMPTVDSTYYPIPYYASLLRGKWYAIKQYIGIAKLASLKNSAPIKYHIEIAESYWTRIFKREGITDRVKMQERLVEEKAKIIDFLTGAENSGKAWFSTFLVTPDGHENHDVKITRIDDSKQGGDWQSDLQEAVNMICFTMRVHSNLVGSVPGKSQTNNSGSDKRELHTIAQAAQKPYRDIMFNVHNLIIAFNGWTGARPTCDFMQLTTLDQHTDARPVTFDNP